VTVPDEAVVELVVKQRPTGFEVLRWLVPQELTGEGRK
jgi:hypothetical protein